MMKMNLMYDSVIACYYCFFHKALAIKMHQLCAATHTFYNDPPQPLLFCRFKALNVLYVINSIHHFYVACTDTQGTWLTTT